VPGREGLYPDMCWGGEGEEDLGRRWEFGDRMGLKPALDRGFAPSVAEIRL
jgi:hypothetical protein